MTVVDCMKSIAVRNSFWKWLFADGADGADWSKMQIVWKKYDTVLGVGNELG